jgi:hypothetical protein
VPAEVLAPPLPWNDDLKQHACLMRRSVRRRHRQQ